MLGTLIILSVRNGTLKISSYAMEGCAEGFEFTPPTPTQQSTPTTFYRQEGEILTV